MKNMNVSLVATWWVKEEFRTEIEKEIKIFTAQILLEEPETLMYKVHFPRFDYPTRVDCKDQIESNPKPDENAIYFYEKYASWEAFQKHLDGKLFQDFKTRNKYKFECVEVKNKCDEKKIEPVIMEPKVEVVFLEEIIGFNR